MPAWWVVLAILRKDLEDAVRSHTLLPMFLGPILLSLFFAQTLSDSDLKRPVVAVAGPESSGLIRSLTASNAIVVERVSSGEEGRQRVLAGKAPVALVVADDFDQRVAAGEYPKLPEIVDDGRKVQQEIARAHVRIAVREMVEQEMPAEIQVVETIRRDREGPGRRMLPYWVAFAVMSSLMVAAVSMVEEKDAGTLEQVLCGPVSLQEVLAGKVSASWLLGFGAAVLMLVLNQAWLGLSGAGILLLALGSLAFAGLGALIGLWAPSQATGSTVAGLTMLALFVPGALAEVSKSMAGAASWSPGYYFQDGVTRALTTGAGISELGPNLGVLAATAVVVFVLGIWRLRRND